MNRELRNLLRQSGLADEQYRPVRLQFALACANRVAHLLIDPNVKQSLECAGRFCRQQVLSPEYEVAVKNVQRLARSHPGTNGMDGAGTAAVSATFAVACALQARAVDAAEYAAYALVYSYASHSVADPQAYDAEYQWQVRALRELLQTQGAGQP